jgi:transposase InsO family protein
MDMPWKETTAMSERKEFVTEAHEERVNISVLCKEYGISRATGYKWLQRYKTEGDPGLQDQSRRPLHSPNQTDAEIETEILRVRSDHPSWGGVKIIAYLKRNGMEKLPSASTITTILQRNEKIDPQESLKHKPIQRFEWEAPNDLWQMDFKGYFSIDQGRCHPLTILDDHSRFLVGLHACSDEVWETVQERLTTTFRQYGLPQRMLMDNGSPWGDDCQSPHTIFTAWLMRLDIAVSHGRPYHPQTQGKDERLHRTFKAELLNRGGLHTLQDCQSQFDRWRDFYNHERPHQAINQMVPAERYHASTRCFPEVLPPILYEPDDIVRIVDISGKISFHSYKFRISKAFRYLPVALRPTEVDGTFDVYYCNFKVAKIDLRYNNS